MSSKNLIICNSCESQITGCQRSVMCSDCQNYYHLNRLCLRLDNIDHDRLTNRNDFKCYQCIEILLPFASISDDLFQIEKPLTKYIPPNDITFNLCDTSQEDDGIFGDVNQAINPDINCYSDINSNVNYYSSDEFNEKLNSLKLKHDELSFLHLNIRSIRNKFDSFLNYLNCLTYKFSIIALTETWLSDDDNSHLFDIPGYSLIQLNRKNRVGGGICLFVREHLKYQLRKDLTFTGHDKSIESLFIEISLEKNKNIIIGTIYRPPNNRYSDFECDLNFILSKLDRKDKPCYILGDFNIDLLKYDKCNFSHQFFNQLSSSGFRPLITKPTRITSSSATLIDNIFTNSQTSEHLNGILINDISDHLPVFAITKNVESYGLHNSSDQGSYKTRVIKQSSLRSFYNYLKTCKWNTTMKEIDPQKSMEIFLTDFLKLYDKYFPLREVKLRNGNREKNVWITKGFKKSSRTKEKLYRRFLKKPTENNRVKYKVYRNKLNHLIRIAKKNYFNNKIHDAQNDPKSTWQTINELIGKKNKNKTLPTSFKYENKDIDDSKEIANQFNNFFVNVGPNLAKSFSNSNEFVKYLKGNYRDSMFLKETTTDEIIKIIQHLKNKNSCGIDEINIKVIKFVAPLIALPLSHIFNNSFISGQVPDELKVALVSPVYKASDKNDFSNYRPISVLPCFSKILERIMYNRMIDFIEKYKILSDHQYGFRAKRSTNHAIIELVDKITNSIEKNELTVGIFLDLSKAFDTVNHSILLKKLNFYGLRGKCHDWIRNYLTNRKQIVKYNNIKSDEMTITCGVPQGSILGPLLFLIYINDLPNSSNKLSSIIFADDTNLFYSGKEIVQIQNQINEELKNVQEWLKLNQLTLNIKKSNFIIFKSNRKKNSIELKIKINDENIMRKQQTKFLGLIIDEHLTWKDHINYISKKITKTIGILCRIRFYIKQPQLKLIYNTLIYPYLYYGNIVWANNYPTRLEKLLKLQKKALRIMSFSAYTAPSLPLFKNMKLLNIHQINDFLISAFSFELSHKILPPYFDDFFRENNKIHEHNTRKNSDIHKRCNRTNYGKYSTRNKITNIWNTIPLEIRKSVSLSVFKKKMKHFLLTHEQ